jgi:hypothetical protein
LSIIKTLSKKEYLPIGLRALLKSYDKRATDLREVRQGDVLLVSYPKSGRTWLHVMVSRLFTLQHGLDPNLLIEGSNIHDLNPAVPRLYISHMTGIDPNTDRGFQKAIRAKKLILLVRNPIDVAVSTYHHHAVGRINPKKRKIKEYLGYTPADATATDIRDFVRNDNWGVPDVIAYMNTWYRFVAERPGSLIVRYEDVVANTLAEMTSVAAFLDAQVSPGTLAAAVEMSGLEALRDQEKRGVFKNASMKPRDPSNPNSFKVRRGKAGGYTDDLDPADVAQLQAMIDKNLHPSFGYGMR